MSHCGPRPLLIQYLPLYDDHQKRRHEVRPGLSGHAQVNGRNAISWEDKFELDVEYVDNVSFIGDWKIIFLTLKKAFMREDINSETAATMEPFKGLCKWEKYIIYERYQSLKKKVMEKIKDSKNNYPILIHPNVICSNKVKIGEGSIICAGNIITVNIEIGKHVIINLDCTIGHDAILGDYTTVLPSVNISGFVKTEECVSIGTGSAITQGVIIGKNSVIGAGAVVVKDLPANCTAVGIPAKPIKFHD
jgi:sugar O-acyltransferase (sialic acid O-acetyltransferase NeuD family)